MRAFLIIALKIAVTAGLIYIVFRNVDVNLAWQQIERISYLLIAACLGLLLLQMLLGAWRWQVICERLLDSRLSYWPATRLALIGIFFNQFLVTTVGGDIVRVWGAYRLGHKLEEAFVGVALDRVVGVLTVALMVAFGAPVLWSLIGTEGLVTGSLAGAGLVMAGAIAIATMDKWTRWLPRWRVVTGFASLATYFRRLAGKPMLSLYVIALSLAAHGINVYLATLITAALGEPLSLIEASVIIPAVILFASLPISIGGWGIREGAMVVAAGFVGISAETATILSLALGFLTLALSLSGGLLWVLTMRGEGQAIWAVAKNARARTT